jgi:glycosyltransferase involved in cell wall biosynthesis
LRILTTLQHLQRVDWPQRPEAIDPEAMPLPRLLWQLVRRAGAYDVVILNGSGHRDQLAAMLLRRLRPRVAIVITDCTWKVEPSGLRRFATRLGIRLMDGPRTNYCVLSSAEREMFPETWRVDPGRVFLTHWYVWLSEQEEATEVSERGAVFSGGDSLRDYRPLIEAAGEIDAPVRIATRTEPPVASASIPSNVRFGPLAQDEYTRELCEASVVVVALAAEGERSAGQNNYLNPVALGKLVVINDATGVRDYLRDRETALIVPSDDAVALAEVLRWALDKANAEQAATIKDRGRKDVGERFTAERYVARLCEIAEQVAGGAR